MPNNDNDDELPDPRSYPSPLISFILPTYNAARYLTHCLDAITRQSFTKFQIIAVDGQSDDGTSEILDDRKEREPRLRVIHEHKEIGPGNARNIAAKKAAGEYLWFIDGDDIIAGDCLGAIAQSLRLNGPDVLLVGYDVLDERGRLEDRKVPTWNSAACFNVADWPGVLDFSLAAWNKIIRREFFQAVGVKFRDKWPHEDVPVSSLLLLEAQKISALPQVCYRYTSNRPSSAVNAGKPRRHFEVFESWRLVLDPAQKRAESGEPLITSKVYQVLFERAIMHMSWVLDAGGFGVGRFGLGGYVLRRDRREFFTTMHGMGRYAPSGYQPAQGGRWRRWKIQLILDGSYWRYEVLDPPNKMRAWLRDMHRRGRWRPASRGARAGQTARAQ